MIGGAGVGVGVPELLIMAMIVVFGIVPWIAAIWALVTLSRVRRGVDAMRGSLDRIEQQLRR